jgi:broad-specificity NMP kinase
LACHGRTAFQNKADVSSIIASLARHGTFIAIIIILRKPLPRLILSLHKLSYKENKALHTEPGAICLAD